MANPIKSGRTITSNFSPLYRITLADIKGLGAVLSGDIKLDSIPDGAIITRTFVKAVTPVAGVATCVGYVKTANHNYGTTTFDLKAAVADTNSDLYVTPQKESYSANTDVLFHMITTTDNLSAATAGEVDVYFSYIVLK